jgi:MFS family permease
MAVTPIPARRADPPAASRPVLFTRTFATLAAASFAYFTSVGILLPALPRYVAGPLAGGGVAVGVVVGAFSVSAVLVRPLAGGLGDRRGRRPLLLVGALVVAISVLGYGVAPGPVALVGLRLLTGAGEALFFVGMATTFTDLAPPERRGEAMSLASLALYLGIGVGPVLGELAIARAGFDGAWVLAGAAAVLAAGLVTRLPETRPDRPTGDAVPVHRLVHPAGLLPGLTLFASVAGMAGFLTFVPLHALDVGLGGASGVLAAFAGVVVLIRSVGARLPDQLGPVRAIRASLCVSAAGLALAGTWQTGPGLVTAALVFGAGIALLTPSVFAWAVAGVGPHERAQVMGTTSAFLDLAFGVGPVGMGVVAATAGRPAAFLAGAVLAVAGLALVVVAGVGRQERPAEAVA